jgi:hypothetical protein
VSNVLTMMATKMGDPIADVVLVEADDLALHSPSQPEHRRTTRGAPRRSSQLLTARTSAGTE